VNRTPSFLPALSTFAALGALALLGPACEAETSTSAPDTPSNDDAGAPAVDCPAPTAGPTKHSGDVKDGEVWTAAGSPHIVEGDVNVRDGATLTIEPCAEVRMARGSKINVAYPLTPNSGKLVAEGTATKPITFTSDGVDRWGGIQVYAPGTVRLAYATLSNGGEGIDHGATILAVGDDEPPTADPLVFVDHVTIEKSRGTGIWLRRRSTFIEGSRDLTITGSGDDEAPFPLEVSDQAIDSIPTGKYTGNRTDEILVRTEGDGMAGSGLVNDATLRDHGVPYRMNDSASADFVIGGASHGRVTTLTIEPGVVMKFHPGTAFMVQLFTTSEPSTGVVKAQGTADKPIVFTSASPTPKAGDWRGLWFGGIPSAANVLDHVRIEYAGFDCSCSLVTCSANVEEYEGAVIFTQQPPSAFITNSVFKEIAGHAITQGFDGSLVNFRPTNTFEGVTGCVQTMPRGADTSCPDPRPICDGE